MVCISLRLRHNHKTMKHVAISKHIRNNKMFSCYALFFRGGQTVFGKSSNLFYSLGALYFIFLFPGFSFTRSNDLIIRESPPVDFHGYAHSDQHTQINLIFFLPKDLSDKLSVHFFFVSFQAREYLCCDSKSLDSSGRRSLATYAPTIFSSLFLGRHVLDTIFIPSRGRQIFQFVWCHEEVHVLWLVSDHSLRASNRDPRAQPASLPGRVLSRWFVLDAISVAVDEQPVVSPDVRVP
jgi:hypothetical protein